MVTLTSPGKGWRKQRFEVCIGVIVVGDYKNQNTVGHTRYFSMKHFQTFFKLSYICLAAKLLLKAIKSLSVLKNQILLELPSLSQLFVLSLQTVQKKGKLLFSGYSNIRLGALKKTTGNAYFGSLQTHLTQKHSLLAYCSVDPFKKLFKLNRNKYKNKYSQLSDVMHSTKHTSRFFVVQQWNKEQTTGLTLSQMNVNCYSY